MTQPAGGAASAHNAMVRIDETPDPDPAILAEGPGEEVNTEKETPPHVLE